MLPSSRSQSAATTALRKVHGELFRVKRDGCTKSHTGAWGGFWGARIKETSMLLRTCALSPTDVCCARYLLSLSSLHATSTDTYKVATRHGIEGRTI